jgi:hypothetical protein
LARFAPRVGCSLPTTPDQIEFYPRAASQEKRGLNPNIWFDNVELIAAKKIGRETVTYVRNIFKYYIAYRLLLDRKTEHDEALKTAAAK